MLIEKLNEAYAKREEETFRLRPSNLGHCHRKLAWILSGIELPPLGSEIRRTFELGAQRGEALEAMAKEVWPDAMAQVPLSIKLGADRLEGTCDLWIPSLSTVVDFKTIATFGFSLLAKEGVSQEYKLQIHAYRQAIFDAGMSMAKHPAEIKAVVVYEAKDSDSRSGIKAQSLAEIEVPWTIELEKQYQDAILSFESMLIRKRQGTLDPRAYPELPLVNGAHPWQCRYCPVGETRGECYTMR